MGIEKINFYSKSNIFNPENLTKDSSLASASMNEYGDLTLVSNIKEKINDASQKNINDDEEILLPEKEGMGNRYKPDKYGTLDRLIKKYELSEELKWDKANKKLKEYNRDQPYKKGKDFDEYIKRKEIKQAIERKVA